MRVDAAATPLTADKPPAPCFNGRLYWVSL